MADDPAKERTLSEAQFKKAQLATEGAQAMSEYNAERQAERAKTARLRELRLAKEAADIAMSLRAKKQIRNPGHHFTNAELAHRRPPELPLQRQWRPCDAYCGVRRASRSDPKDRSNRTKRAFPDRQCPTLPARVAACQTTEMKKGWQAASAGYLRSHAGPGVG